MTRILLLLMLGCQSASQGLNDTGNGVDGPIADTDIEFFEGPAAEERATLFSEDELPVFEIWLDDSEIQDLISDPYSYVKEPYDIEMSSTKMWPCEPEAKTLGDPSMKGLVEDDLNHYDTGPGDVLGLKKITSVPLDEDYGMMHEQVAYRMFGEAQPRGSFTHAIVYLNDELYGLFAHVESVDDTMIGQWFEDNSGSLFEQHDADYYTDYVRTIRIFSWKKGTTIAINSKPQRTRWPILARTPSKPLVNTSTGTISSLTGRSAQWLARLRHLPLPLR